MMTYPLGIDVSSYQRTMDWLKARTTGAKFAFVKATEGSTWVDPTFAFNWSELRRLGIPHGAYHYFRPKENALLQAQEFVDIVDPQGGERLVLDVENSGGLDRNTLTKCVLTALETIKGLTGRYPIMYSRASWLNANLNVSELPKLDYWLAQYKFANPYPFFTDMYPTDKLTAPIGVERQQIKFHQGSERGNGGKYGAASHYIDYDRFIGTDEELASYFGAANVPVSYKARVIADVLNVRSTPEIADNVVGQLTEGAIVNVYEEVVR